jgi:hypothetical protein
MANFNYGTIYGDYGDEKFTSTTNDIGAILGTRMILPDGRVFRYSFSNGAVGAGKGVQSSIALANQDSDIAVSSAAAVGDKTVTVTFGTSPNTDVVADQYADGYLFVNDVDGEGHVYRIKHTDAHLAADVSASPAVDINLHASDGIAVALTTSSEVGLVANPYKDVIITPGGAQTARCVGYTTTSVADDSYFWAQTWGESALFVDGTLVIFTPVRVSDGVAGAVEAYSSDTDSEEQQVGFATNVLAATTEYQFVFLQIAP